jgi:AAA domain-containing protein
MGSGIGEASGVNARKSVTRELRYSKDAIVVLAGIPGAGKSTLLRRLFPDGAYGDVRVLDSGDVRERWMPVLGVIPYSWWRPLVHLTHYVQVLRAMRGDGPLLIHDCATRPWARRLIGWRARRSARPVHLILLDVSGFLARDGQQARGRVVRSGSMATHCRRWPQLLTEAVNDPAHLVPGALSAIILTRRQANNMDKITFGPNRTPAAQAR